MARTKKHTERYRCTEASYMEVAVHPNYQKMPYMGQGLIFDVRQRTTHSGVAIYLSRRDVERLIAWDRSDSYEAENRQTLRLNHVSGGGVRVTATDNHLYKVERQACLSLAQFTQLRAQASNWYLETET